MMNTNCKFKTNVEINILFGCLLFPLLLSQSNQKQSEQICGNTHTKPYTIQVTFIKLYWAGKNTEKATRASRFSVF